MNTIHELIESLKKSLPRDVGIKQEPKSDLERYHDARRTHHHAFWDSKWRKAQLSHTATHRDFEEGHAEVRGLHIEVSKLADGIPKSHPFHQIIHHRLSEANSHLEQSKKVAADGNPHRALGHHVDIALTNIHHALIDVGHAHPNIRSR